MLFSGKIWAKVVVFGQKWLFSWSARSACIQAKWLYSGTVVVSGKKWLYLGKSGCNREKVVVFVQKLLYSGKMWYLGKSGCMLFSGKSGYLGKSSCIRAKMVVFGQSGCIWAEWEYSGKPGCIRAKVVVFRAK